MIYGIVGSNFIFTDERDSVTKTYGISLTKQFHNNFDYTVGTIMIPADISNSSDNNISSFPRIFFGLRYRIPIGKTKSLPITIHTFLPSFIMPFQNHLSINIGYLW